MRGKGGRWEVEADESGEGGNAPHRRTIQYTIHEHHRGPNACNMPHARGRVQHARGDVKRPNDDES